MSLQNASLREIESRVETASAKVERRGDSVDDNGPRHTRECSSDHLLPMEKQDGSNSNYF